MVTRATSPASVPADTGFGDRAPSSAGIVDRLVEVVEISKRLPHCSLVHQLAHGIAVQRIDLVLLVLEQRKHFLVSTVVGAVTSEHPLADARKTKPIIGDRVARVDRTGKIKIVGDRRDDAAVAEKQLDVMKSADREIRIADEVLEHSEQCILKRIEVVGTRALLRENFSTEACAKSVGLFDQKSVTLRANLSAAAVGINELEQSRLVAHGREQLVNAV